MECNQWLVNMHGSRGSSNFVNMKPLGVLPPFSGDFNNTTIFLPLFLFTLCSLRVCRLKAFGSYTHQLHVFRYYTVHCSDVKNYALLRKRLDVYW
jgi:hypothetical protein